MYLTEDPSPNAHTSPTVGKQRDEFGVLGEENVRVEPCRELVTHASHKNITRRCALERLL
jgi:hypothetical protein